MFGEYVLDNIKRFYMEYSFYESLYLSLVISLSVTLAFLLVGLELNYSNIFREFGNVFYIKIFSILFLVVFLLFTLIKPRLNISKEKKTLLVAELFLSFVVVRVIL
jgi:hypothetical protein